MILIIDLSKTPKLILKEKKILDTFEWDGLYQLSETLISNIDKLLKKNKIKLKNLKEIKVIPSEQSMVGTRIAKAVALGLKVEIKENA